MNGKIDKVSPRKLLWARILQDTLKKKVFVENARRKWRLKCQSQQEELTKREIEAREENIRFESSAQLTGNGDVDRKGLGAEQVLGPTAVNSGVFWKDTSKRQNRFGGYGAIRQ